MDFPAPKLPKAFLAKVETIVGAKNYSFKNLDRFNYSRDSNFKSTIRAYLGQSEPLPDIIAWPENAAQVARLVKAASAHKIPVIPFGAGSGVSAGTLALTGGLIIDVKRMRKMVIDEDNLLVEADAGIMSMHLEDQLQRRGYTLGHFPSSIICASLGGCLAARSAGQQSSRYGKIEDMVYQAEVVTGRGEILTTHSVANSSGIDLNQIFLGSEGTLGLFTKAWLKIKPLPPKIEFRGIRFKNMKTAMEAIRRIMQSGLKPSVVRLYDELDTLLVLSSKSPKGHKKGGFWHHLQEEIKFKTVKAGLLAPPMLHRLTKLIPSGCLVILMHEGLDRLVKEERKIVLEIAAELEGEDLGAAPGRQWFENRYRISYNASPIFEAGLFTDTIEVAATWDKLHDLYQAILKVLSPHAMIMAHLSHVYPDGGSLYFTFVAPRANLNRATELYDTIWESALRTCQEVGGVISHHHGIGRLKAKFVNEEWGPAATLFEDLKKFYDPKGILNPGKLYVPRGKKAENIAVGF